MGDGEGVCRLRIVDPNDVAAAFEFLARAHVVACIDADGMIRVSTPGAVSPSHQRREIAGYVVTWNALNPGSLLELLDSATCQSVDHSPTATSLSASG